MRKQEFILTLIKEKKIPVLKSVERKKQSFVPVNMTASAVSFKSLKGRMTKREGEVRKSAGKPHSFSPSLTLYPSFLLKCLGHFSIKRN